MKKLTVLLSVLFAASLSYADVKDTKDDANAKAKQTQADVKAKASDAKDDANAKAAETQAEVKAKAKDAKADANAKAKDAQADAKSKAAKMTHAFEAEIVSVDSAKNTITVKTDKGESTAPVEGKAVAEVKTVKPGQKVTLVCRDDEKGEHKAVTEIKTKTSTTSSMSSKPAEKPAEKK